jgi:hypothetical protein
VGSEGAWTSDEEDDASTDEEEEASPDDEDDVSLDDEDASGDVVSTVGAEDDDEEEDEDGSAAIGGVEEEGDTDGYAEARVGRDDFAVYEGVTSDCTVLDNRETEESEDDKEDSRFEDDEEECEPSKSSIFDR